MQSTMLSQKNDQDKNIETKEHENDSNKAITQNDKNKNESTKQTNLEENKDNDQHKRNNHG